MYTDPYQSTIKCSPPPGAGTNLEVVVYVYGKILAANIDVSNNTMGQPAWGLKNSNCPSCTNTYFSYNQPSLLTISPSLANTAGGTQVTITGSSFSQYSNTTLYLYITSGSSVITYTWNQDSTSSVNGDIVTWFQDLVNPNNPAQIIFKMPPGTGTQVNITISVGGQNAVTPLYINYYSPIIYSVTSSTPRNTTGGNTLTVTGKYFGTDSGVTSVTVGGQPCALSTTVSQTDTSIQCSIPPGIGISNQVLVTVNNQVSTTSGSYNYDPPVITSITPNTANTSALIPVTVYGYNFGSGGTAEADSTTAAATVNSVPCTTISNTQTQIVCTLQPSQGLNVPIKVTAAGQPAQPLLNAFSFANPVITLVTPLYGPTQVCTNIYMQYMYCNNVTLCCTVQSTNVYTVPYTAYMITKYA